MLSRSSETTSRWRINTQNRVKTHHLYASCPPKETTTSDQIARYFFVDGKKKITRLSDDRRRCVITEMQPCHNSGVCVEAGVCLDASFTFTGEPATGDTPGAPHGAHTLRCCTLLATNRPPREGVREHTISLSLSPR